MSCAAQDSVRHKSEVACLVWDAGWEHTPGTAPM